MTAIAIAFLIIALLGLLAIWLLLKEVRYLIDAPVDNDGEHL